MAENYSEFKEQKEDSLAVGAKGGIIAFVLQVSRTGLGFLNQIVLARILGAGGIGEVILALTILNVFGLIAAFGMQGAMIRFVPFYTEKEENAKLKGTVYFTLKFCFLLSIIFVAFILVFSKFIAIDIFHSQALLKLLPVVVIALPANVLNGLIEAILKGYKDTFKALLPHSIISPFFRLTIFLLLTIIDISSLYAIIAFVSGEILAMALSLIFLLKRVGKIKPVYQWSEYKKVLGVASALIFTNFSWYLYTQADIWIVGMFSSTESVGIYGVVSRLVTLIAFSLGAFSTIVPSIISAVHTSNNRDELRQVVSVSTRWILTMSMPIMLILVLEGKFVLEYVYGEKFINGYTALVILSIGQLINAGSGLVGWFLQVTGGHKTYMKISIFWGILNVLLNLILVPRFGIIGAAMSTAFTLSMVNIISVWVIYNKLSILTLAKGLKFDVVFAVVVATLYFLFKYNDFYIGHHLLLISALIVYVWKSIVNGDLPWRYLTAKYKI